MFFQGSPAHRPMPPGPEPSPVDENEGLYFVDFGAIFAEEMNRVLRRRAEGMMCELVFWQDEYRF